MKSNLQNIFELFMDSDYYNNSKIEINISWLHEKLEAIDMDKLEIYIAELLIKNEEELFINTLKFVWDIYRELSYD